MSYTSKITECVCGAKASLSITQASFTDTPKDAPTKSDIQELLSYVSKYHKLKEVIQNIIDRLDEGSEMTLTKDSIIVHCLKEAIK